MLSNSRGSHQKEADEQAGRTSPDDGRSRIANNRTRPNGAGIKYWKEESEQAEAGETWRREREFQRPTAARLKATLIADGKVRKGSRYFSSEDPTTVCRERRREGDC